MALIAWILIWTLSGAGQASASDLLLQSLKSYEGQYRILRNGGEERSIRMDFRRPRLDEDCDVAVQILTVAVERDTLRLLLEPIGRLNVGARHPLCGDVPREIEFVLTNLPEVDSVARVREVLESHLVTAETYLSDRGLAYDRIGEGPEAGFRLRPAASTSEPGGGSCWMVVFPFAPSHVRIDEETGLRVLMEVKLDVDGTLRDPRAVAETPIGIFREVVRALTLWRCEPFVENGERVPMTLQVPVRFVKYDN